MIGTTISHYRIVAELGKGGMGVVYKAEDTRLNRTVALKLLAPHMLASESDRSRFYREARAAAALHHPNIATVFEIDETEDGRPFIAMEFIEGKSLEALIDEGPLKLDKAISIAIQIAEALKAAHEKQIVHRDIKSANMMLTADGRAKVLDFGLAKTTASTKLTQMGSTLGTAAYMSPEQTRGEEVDHRTDLWSLGAVLYEMISGRLPFAGDYEQAVVYNILNDEPQPLTAIRTGVPMELEQVVNKCLRKESDLRYQSAAGVIADLKATTAGDSVSPGISAAHSAVRPRAGTPVVIRPRFKRWMVGVGALIGLGVGWAIGRIDGGALTTQVSLPSYYSLLLETGHRLMHPYPAIALSRDGKHLAFATQDTVSGSSRIYVRRLTDRNLTPVPGSEGGRTPFFSPDGNTLGYLVDDRIYIYNLATDATEPVAGKGSRDGMYWADDGTIVFEREGRFMQVRRGDSEPIPLASTNVNSVVLESGQFEERAPPGTAWSPYYLPEPGVVVYSNWYFGQGTGEVRLLDLEDGTVRTLIEDATDARVVANHLWFVRRGSLYSVGFDARKAAVTGTAVLVQERVSGSFRGHYAYSVSLNGTVIFVPDDGDGEVAVWVDRTGKSAPLGIEAALSMNFAEISPDGARVAYQKITQAGFNLWTYDVALDRDEQFSFGTKGVSGGSPTWTPDGSHILYQTEGITRIAHIDGREAPVDYPQVGFYISHAPKSQTIMTAGDGRVRSFMYPDTTTRTLLELEGATVLEPSLSPDERWLAYSSNDGGTFQVYVTDYPDGTFRRRISRSRGTEPRWSPAGGELFFRDQQWLVSVTYASDPTFEASEPVYLFEGPYSHSIGGKPYYDVDIDGQRFFMFNRVSSAAVNTIEVIQNAVL